MNRRIEKAAVLGAGTMGARIAAHLANAGIPCFLLDIVPTELKPRRAAQGLTLAIPAVRNRIVRAGLEAAKKSRPAAFFTPETAAPRSPPEISTTTSPGARQADWIIEAVAENLEIKRKLFERVEARPQSRHDRHHQHLRPARFVRSPKDTPTDFQQPLGRHAFFQSAALHEARRTDSRSGDVPRSAGRARRYSVTAVSAKASCAPKTLPISSPTASALFPCSTSLRLMSELGMTVEEVDACTGPAIGWPKSATFRTADIVGLDVLVHVVRNIYESIPDDESREMYRVPPFSKK